MGYQHIDNLYKNQDILSFKECYAMEKIHGTSTHISWKHDKLIFFSGGCKFETFKGLFNVDYLEEKFKEIGIPDVAVYGEGYGGKQQGMSNLYGNELKFVAFEVRIGDTWLNVPDAEKFVNSLDLEFVWYIRTTTDLKTLDYWRDATSAQALRNGRGVLTPSERIGEGIVLRPLIELTKNNGKRVVAKHKGAAFSENRTVRKVELSDAKLKALAQVKEICNDWVTENRLSNILSHIPEPLDLPMIPKLITLMIEDVLREGEGEVIESRELKQAISRETALMIKRRVQKI